jgi:phosphoribosyl-ATP pyrophosphohydrolase
MRSSLARGSGNFLALHQSLHLANRVEILTNTHSLFSVVTHGAGLTSEAAFIRRALEAIREKLRESGREFAWERQIEPAVMSVRFARLADRRVMGSMNDLIYMAKVYMEDRDMSPRELSARLNETPLSLLWKRGPAGSPERAFDQMGLDSTGG